MKRRIVIFLTAILAVCLGFSILTACGDNNDESKNNESVKKISSTLLDGKVANLMGAQGFGILEKRTQVVLTSNSNSNRILLENNEKEQKKTEFIKETSSGYVDVHFHDSDSKNGYKDLNKKYAKHHHKGVECSLTDCDEISDEITSEEANGNSNTIMSLDARINKLYNYKDFTFMSVSSAIEGEIQVLFNVYRPSLDMSNLMSFKYSYPTLINIENQFDSKNSGWQFGYINIPSTETSPAGIIPMKINENETGYHTANYWSDDYNQSYIIDNNTGKTYSLARFPYIYSVDNGIIKVHDETAKGWFRFYKPIVTESGLTFEEINLPDDNDFVSNLSVCASSSSVMLDVYGNMIFNSVGKVSENFQCDEYGEKKYGNNVILSLPNYRHYTELKNKNRYGYHADLFASRYLKANRYHRGSDGRIYRVDFKGFLGDVKVHVLDENCNWQQVDDSVNVTFDNFYGGICWWVGLNQASIDSYRITKIANGYAYYSTACASDGVHIWDSVIINNELKELGEYTGVVKIPVNGPDNNSHLSIYEEFEQNNVNTLDNYTIFLVGDTQMLYHVNNKLFIYDVETGKKSFITTTDEKIFKDIHKNNLVFSVNGQTKFLNVLMEANAENLEKSLSSTEVIIGGELDAYFKFLTGKE